MKVIYYVFFICFALACTTSTNSETVAQKEPGDELKLAEDSPAFDTVAVEARETFPIQFEPEDEIIGLGETQFGDLDSMIARRRIRALVPYNHTYYFIDGAERRGLAFEALNMFEKSLNEYLELSTGVPKVRVIFIPTSHDQIIPLLKNGYGDLAVSGLTVTPDREEIIEFSIPTLTDMNEVLVSGPKASEVTSRSSLTDKKVYVHPTSSFKQGLVKLSDSLQKIGKAAIQIEPLAEYLETEDALQMVNAGVIPFTVVEENIALHWEKVLDSLVVHRDIIVNPKASYAWAFRKNSPRLEKEVNRFLQENRKGTLMGNILFNRYMKSEQYLKNALAPPVVERLDDIQALFRKYGKRYNLDWLLLAAQGYQESQLQQNTKSSAGAIGIMQIKPTTAAGDPINIQGVDKVENNIHAGAKYLRFITDRSFSDDNMDLLNRGLFALAAYNAGPARVSRLRKKAASQGLNPNLWFDNVEMVAAKEIGRETVQYVSNKYKYYTSFRSLKQYAQASGKPIIKGS